MIVAENSNSAVRLQFTLRDFSALFEQPIGLGASGEVFLLDSAGMLLTPSRFRAPILPAAFTESDSCASAPSEREEIDDRGVATIHGVQSVSAFTVPICVDAHISHDEALAPAAALLVDLVTRAALFSVVGALLARIAAHWMSAPVQRLAASATGP